MKVKVTGTVVEVQKKTGVSKKGGEWVNTTVVVEKVNGNYKDYFPVSFFGEKSELVDGLTKGTEVEVEFYLTGKEYNGKYYSELRGLDCSIQMNADRPAAPKITVEPDSDSLPF